MRVALVDTLDKAHAGSGPNVAIAALAGYLLEAGHEVGVIDLFFSSEEEQRHFFQQQWGLVGITATSFAFSVALHTAKAIKAISPGPPPIVLGGAHACVARQEVLAEPEIDFAIYGEGEVPLRSLAELIEREEHPTEKHFREIDGLIFCQGEDAVVNPPTSRIINLDSSPLPPYNLFPMDRYSTHTLSTSRGCPYGCAFCASATIFGNKWVPKSPQRILEEIEYAISRWGKKPISVVDDSFNLNIERVKAICRLLIDKEIDIRWEMCGGMRADKIDLEMLLLMKRSGCNGIGIGVESANPQILKNIGKGETIEQIRECIHLVKKAGMPIHASFMIGNPGDTLETVKESIEFARSEHLDNFCAFIAVPYPNTELWRYIEENGRFLRTDYINYHDYSEEPAFETDDFPFHHRVEAYRLAKREMLRLRQGSGFQRILRFARAFYSEVCSARPLSALRNKSSDQERLCLEKFGSQSKKPSTANNGFRRIETRLSRQG